MGEHPYVLPDPAKCPYCGRNRYYRDRTWRHFTPEALRLCVAESRTDRPVIGAQQEMT